MRSHLRAFDIFFFAYLIIVCLLTFLYREGITNWTDILLKNMLMCFAVCFFIAFGENSKSALLRFCRFWYLCAGVPILFTELRYITHVVRPVDYDDVLIALDRLLCGVHPTVWLERFVHPVVTDILRVFYVLYLPLPLPLGFLLYCRKREDEFYAFTTAVSMLFFFSFLGYLTVPAIGPQHTLASYQHIPLHGMWCGDRLMEFIDSMDRLNRDCFPSGHAAMAVMVCIESYLRGRVLFPLYLVMGTGVILGTVYLRYHYVVDLPPGILLAVFCSIASRRLVPWWEKTIRGRPYPT